ncbi:unnamed protein product [Staurois parvus]|uniref:Uncharacterized protein n=1 Tax=Staurois parvus TaxID=386267 RepID=A0ABN9D6H5_9NEOB|nr:unnamed protein product [Staurois parvus]
MRKGIKQFIFTKIIAFPCSVYCGRPDIVNAGSWETRYKTWELSGGGMEWRKGSSDLHV